MLTILICNFNSSLFYNKKNAATSSSGNEGDATVSSNNGNLAASPVNEKTITVVSLNDNSTPASPLNDGNIAKIYPINGQNSMTVELKYSLRHFDMFRTAFKEKMLEINDENYIFGMKRQGVRDDEKKILDENSEDLKLLLDMINFTNLFYTEEPEIKKSMNKDIMKFDVNSLKTMTAMASKNMFEKILADPNVFTALVKDIIQIRNIFTLDLSLFTINHIPLGLEIFSIANMIILDETGISSLDGLDGLKMITHISACNNNITEIPALKNSPAIIRMNLIGNNITKISPDFLLNHKFLVLVGLASKHYGMLPQEVIDAADKSDGKIINVDAV